MGKVVVTEFITLDGVFEDPGGAEKFKYGGWSFKIARGPDGDKFKLDELQASDALLLGRVTYEGFAAAWPDRKDDVGFADKFNHMPKYVVSNSLNEKDLTWENSHLIKDLVPEVNQLKKQYQGDIVVHGSGTLVRSLMGDNLIDEYRLMVYPVVLGSGRRLFEGASKLTMKLAGTQPVGDGVVILTYTPAPK